MLFNKETKPNIFCVLFVYYVLVVIYKSYVVLKRATIFAADDYRRRNVVTSQRDRYSAYKVNRSGVMGIVLNCDILINELDLQSNYYVPFRTNNFGKYIKPFISQSSSTTTILLQV